MNLYLTIMSAIVNIQIYTEAMFLPPFGHHGHPGHPGHLMKPHPFGPGMHGPLMGHGLPKPVIYVHGPPMHAPFHMPKHYIMGYRGPAFRPHIQHYSNDHHMSKLQQSTLYPLKQKYSQNAMRKTFKPMKVLKKPKRILLIRQRNNMNMPNAHEYQRQMSRVAKSLYEHGINYNNYERSRYDSSNHNINNLSKGRVNINTRNALSQRRNQVNTHQFNERNWNAITDVGNTRNYENIRNFRSNANLNPPHLREVVDTSNRVEIRKNSVKSRNVGGSVQRQSLGPRQNKDKVNSLSGNIIDLTGAKVISSNKNYGREILSSNYLDKSNSGIQSEKVNLRRERIKSSTKRTDTSSRVTLLNGSKSKSNEGNNNNNLNNNNGNNLRKSLNNNNGKNKSNKREMLKNNNAIISNSNNINSNRAIIANSKNIMSNSKSKNTDISKRKSSLGQKNGSNNKTVDKNTSNSNQSNTNSKSNNNANKSTKVNSKNSKTSNSKRNIGNNNNNNNNINKNGINHQGLGGSLLDFTNMGFEASANTQKNMLNTGNSASSVLSSGGNVFGSGSTIMPSDFVNSNNANNAATSAAADLNGNSIKSAGNLLSASDLLLIDSNGLTPAEVAATAIPMASDVLSGVVDLSATGGNTNNVGGTNFDVLTLDKGAFAQLEHALQTGQTVNAKFLDSIISGSGTTNNGGGFTSSLASPSATVDLTDPALTAAPQIIILDQAQAQHLTGSAGLGGLSGDPHVVDLHSLTSSSSHSAKSSEQISSTTSTGHSSVDVPHAGKVIPAVPNLHMSGSHTGSTMGDHSHGHGIVGILGEPIKAITMGSNSDLIGLFSMPDASNLSNIPASVVSIPESIGRRMSSGHQHSGQTGSMDSQMPAGHQHSAQTDMSSISHSTDNRMSAGHSSHSSHGVHCKL